MLKNHKIINTILLCVNLLGLLSLNAQDDYFNKQKLLYNEDFFEKAALIIEGKMLKSFDSYDAKGNYNPNDIYTPQAILVQRVYKGDAKLTNDTIYVIRHFGTISKEIEHGWIEFIGLPDIVNDHGYFDEGVYVRKEHSDLLFFIKSDFPDNPAKTQYCNKPKYRFLQDKHKAVLRMNEKITGLNNLIFNNREELYNYMKQFKDCTIPDIPVNISPIKEYND